VCRNEESFLLHGRENYLQCDWRGGDPIRTIRWSGQGVVAHEARLQYMCAGSGNMCVLSRATITYAPPRDFRFILTEVEVQIIRATCADFAVVAIATPASPPIHIFPSLLASL
jgi:hypothetical protein